MSKIAKKRGFTLFELILVIFIIGILYTLIGISFDRFLVKEKFKFENLKELMLKYKSDNILKLVCYRDCKKCVIFENSEIIEKYIDLKLDRNLKIYATDEFGELIQVEFEDRYIDKTVEFPELERICFEYKLFPNGSSSSFVVFNYKEYYVFDSYFGDVDIFNEEDLAKEFFLQRDYYPTYSGDYYEK